jgi:peptidyl-prolyl cis-trans isomerase C
MAAEVEKLNVTSDPVVAASLKTARDRVLAELMLSRIDAANTPSDDALDKLALAQYRADPKKYETPAAVNTRHILIRSSTPGAKGKIELLLQQLQSGVDFETLAKSESQDPRSAARGGEVGFAERGKMVSQFETAAWALKAPGDMSGIVQTEYGFHIIKLIAKRDAGLRPFEDVRAQLRAEVLANVLNAARKAEAQRLLGSAKFEESAIEAFATSQQR